MMSGAVVVLLLALSQRLFILSVKCDAWLVAAAAASGRSPSDCE